jgi:hypothetical protein
MNTKAHKLSDERKCSMAYNTAISKYQNEMFTHAVTMTGEEDSIWVQEIHKIALTSALAHYNVNTKNCFFNETYTKDRLETVTYLLQLYIWCLLQMIELNNMLV